MRFWHRTAEALSHGKSTSKSPPPKTFWVFLSCRRAHPPLPSHPPSPPTLSTTPFRLADIIWEQAYYTAFDIDNYKVGFATRNNASQCGNSLYTARYPSLLKLKDQGSGGFFSNKTNLILVCVAIGVFVGAVIGAIYYFWPMKPRTPAGVEMSRTGASLEEQA
mmetsp:Transcript_22866/g.54049  ORF Transcript_22866/g.54049 Transcript_22866/m.54049 type:complete len:163 (+) Transcript_22866:801-1289(+)